MPADVQYSLEIHSKVEAEICGLLARRSVFASAIYLTLYSCICSLTSIYSDYPTRTVTLGLVLFTFSLSRLILAMNHKKIRQEIWKKAFFATVLMGSATWGMFCFLTIFSYGVSQNSLILLFTTAGIASGSILSLAPFFRLIAWHLSLILMPIIAGMMHTTHSQGFVYESLTAIYFVYLLIQAHTIAGSVGGDLRKQEVILNQNIALEEANQKTVAAKTAKEQFLANISHEIRTPLNGVIGTTDLLLETYLEKEQRHYVEVIQSSGTVLLSLVNQVLDLAKIEAGKMRFENVAFDLKTLIEGQTELLAAPAQEKHLMLNTTVSPRLPKNLIGDPGRIGQILLNLIGNAIKFTNKGAVTIRALELTTPAPNPEAVLVRFEVEDTGVGIDPKSLHNLFHPFEQIDGSTSRQYGGTGLGLSICKNLAEKMGGRVGVHSTLNKGSTFWFEIPFTNAEVSCAVEPTKNVLPKPEQALHILVADDVATNLMLTTKMLQKLGYFAHGVGNGLEAIAALDRADFDLILMDCQMPEMDGYEATRLIRGMASSKMKNIPIVALTANAMAGDKDKCIEAGMNDYLAKPLKKDKLAQVLAKWLLQQKEKAA